MNRATPSGVSGATATTVAPAAVNRSMSSRNCERCLRQNGQPKPRRKTSTTGPDAVTEDSWNGTPCWSVRVKSGATAPTPAVRLWTLIGRSVLTTSRDEGTNDGVDCSRGRERAAVGGLHGRGARTGPLQDDRRARRRGAAHDVRR